MKETGQKLKPSSQRFVSFAGQAHHFPVRSFSQSTVASNYMNQSASISIIIGGTVAKQVQPLSLHATSDADLWMQGSLLASMQTCTPPAMPGTACHNHKKNRFSKYSSSHLQPGALTCIESHDCVSFPQLDCNSATGLIAVSARSHADLWMQAHYSLQYRPVHTLPCPMQHFTI